MRLSARRGKAEAKEPPFVSAFLFFLGGGRGFYLRSVAPSAPPQTPTYPTAREMWRHSFADAKRRKFKFSVFRVRVSVSQIYKFNVKFERKTIRRSIFSLDEAETTEARERTGRP